MTYAHVSTGVIDQIGQPPRLHFDGTRWWDLRSRDPQLLAQLGWLPVINTPQPADTDTHTSDLAYELIDGQPPEVWMVRPWTAEELAEKAAAAEKEAARVAVSGIIDALKAEKDRVQLVIDKANAQIGGADTKDVARAAKRIADAAIDLARFVRE